MPQRKRRQHSPAFKAKVVLAATKGDRTLAELAEHFDIHPNHIQEWTKKLLANVEQVFGSGVGEATQRERAIEKLHATIGQLTMENDFFIHNARSRPMSERRAMIHATHTLSVSRRCELLGVPRSTAYYQAKPVSEEDLKLMRLIDAIHLELPFYGSRRMRDELEDRGYAVNRKRVQRQMDLRALYPEPRTSHPRQGHTMYPYRLADVSIERPNQVIDKMMLAKYRQAFTPSRAKDDPTDAELQLELLLCHRDKLTPLVPQSPEMRALAQLVEHRRRLVSDRVRMTN